LWQKNETFISHDRKALRQLYESPGASFFSFFKQILVHSISSMLAKINRAFQKVKVSFCAQELGYRTTLLSFILSSTLLSIFVFDRSERAQKRTLDVAQALITQSPLVVISNAFCQVRNIYFVQD
jgi:hypothetical protein